MPIINVTRKSLIIQGLVFLLLGILFVAFPEGILKSISIYLGFLMMIPGIVMILTPLIKKNYQTNSPLLAEGLLLALFGLLLVVKPEIVGKLLAIFVGIWMIGGGTIQFAASFEKKQLQWRYWWIQLLAGICLVILGIIILFNAFSFSVIVTVWFGTILIAFGIYYLFLAFMLYS